MMDSFLLQSEYFAVPYLLGTSLSWHLLYTLNLGKKGLFFVDTRYIFFVTLLSIPESSFTVAFKMFDLDNNG